jgi:hypothetical protein
MMFERVDIQLHVPAVIIQVQFGSKSEIPQIGNTVIAECSPIEHARGREGNARQQSGRSTPLS